MTRFQEQPREKERRGANFLIVKENKGRLTFRTKRAPLQMRGQESANWSEKIGEMTHQLENVQNQLQRKDHECLTLQKKFQQLQNEVSILRRQREEQCQEVEEMRHQKASVETQLRQMEQQLLWERDRVEAQNQRLKEME